MAIGSIAFGGTSAGITKATADSSYAPISGSANYVAGLFVPSTRMKAMAENVALAVAPTVTQLDNTTSTLTGHKLVASTAAGAPFRYRLSDVGNFSGQYVFTLGNTGTSARTYDQSQSLIVAFDFDGQAFEIDLRKFTTGNQQFRVWANEQVSPTTVCTSNNSAEQYIKVDFGTRAYRRIVIEIDACALFGGIVIGGADTIVPPSEVTAKKLAVVGDSYAYGTGINVSNPDARAYVTQLARVLGFADYRRYAVSGTGFLTTPGSPAVTYINRIADVIANAPDLCIVQGSINDSALTSAAVQTAATTYLTTLKAGLPAASKIVLTAPLRALAPITGDVTITVGLAAAAAAVGVPFVDAVNTGWFTGSGTTAAQNGTGNADWYQSSNPVNHPSLAGHTYLGNQLAREVAAALAIPL